VTVLETERLRLRRFRDDDRDTLARWNADPLFMRHMGRPPMTRFESARALRRHEEHWRDHGFGLLAVDDRVTGTLVGRAGVQYHRAWPQDPEVGWSFDPEWWGRGLATEAGAACIGWAFGELDLPRLVSITVEDNLASRRVMEKLGFRLLETRDDEQLGLTLWIHALSRPSEQVQPGKRGPRPPESRLT
jgi:RimJ/RimL family protein N-acetyltransferase